MSTSRGQWFWGETSTTGLFNFLILLDIKHHCTGRFFVTFLQKRVLMHFYKMRIMNINPDCTEISKWVINHELLFVFTCQYSTKENKKANLIHSTEKKKIVMSYYLACQGYIHVFLLRIPQRSGFKKCFYIRYLFNAFKINLKEYLLALW